MQSTQTPTESKSEEKLDIHNLFEQIYQIAKSSTDDVEGATQKLKNLLAIGAFIDMRSPADELTPAGKYTPAEKLAMEGDFKAAMFLIDLGANINLAARGAAKGDHIEWAEYCRIHYGASASIVASGAAEAKLTDYVDILQLKYGANKNQIAFGYAKGGDLKNAEEFRIKYEADPTYIACGATAGGQIDYAEVLRTQVGVDIHQLAWFAGMCRYANYAERLRMFGAEPKAIASGAAYSCDRNSSERLRVDQGVKPEIISMAAACAGDLHYAELLRRNFCNGNHVFVVWGAVLAGYHAYAESFKNQTVLPPNLNIFPAHYYLNFSYSTKKIAMHVFYHMNTDKHRIQVAERLKHEPFIKYNIVGVALKISEFKKQYSFEQCLALEKIELVIWYLQCWSLVQSHRLDANLFFSIATYLSPLTVNESKDILGNLRFNTHHKFLMKDLNKYCNANKRYGFFNKDKNVVIFSSICAELKNMSEVRGLLESEFKNMADTEPAKKIIGRHYKRFD